MNVSFDWLNELVDLKDISIKEFCDKMTMTGSKVETYFKNRSIDDNIVAGKILNITKHENANNLVLCLIDIGTSRDIQIITGATNIKVDDIVPCALENALLPNGTKITNTNLRGILSEGMLCSIVELDFSIKNFPNAIKDGILILSPQIEVGTKINTMSTKNDTIIEFEITPNRTDCLSMRGIAVEAGATFKRDIKFKEPVIGLESSTIFDKMQVKLSTDKCNRYMSKLIKDVTITQSPEWLQKRLISSGINPINNMVDITNYVMVELGQPMHCFDLDKIKSKKLKVCFAKNNEEFCGLDGKEYKLNNTIPVIKDSSSIIAIAGILGGENTQVDENTKNVMFECISFDGTTIRNASKSLNLRTESSTKFEKNINPNLCYSAILRACELVNSLHYGTVIGGVIDIYNNPVNNPPIELDVKRINNLLGTDISVDEMNGILTSLQFKVTNNNVTPPYFRTDISHTADLAEEIARIHGYDNIPTTLPKSDIVAYRTPEEIFIDKLKNTLTSCGLSEILTYSFISPKVYSKVNLNMEEEIQNSVKIKNPLGEDTSVMRTTALPSLMKVLELNHNNRNLNVRVFEIAKEYKKTNDKLPLETNKLICGLYGDDTDFYSLKSLLNAILENFNIQNYKYIPFVNNKSYHEGRCAELLVNDKHLAVLGEIHPTVLSNYNIKTRCYVLELDLQVLNEVQNKLNDYVSLPKFPAVTRDLALICHKYVLVGDIKETMIKCCAEILEDIKLFDVFTNESIGVDNKSVAFSLVLRSHKNTLKDKDIDTIINNILTELDKINVTLRV